MTGVEGVGAIGPIGDMGAPMALRLEGLPPQVSPQPTVSFGEVLMAGLRTVDAKLANADALTRQFAVDDTVPVHQVTIALEEARLSVELAMQVRTRLLDGYRELMNMQL